MTSMSMFTFLRFSEDLIVYGTARFGFLQLADACFMGSIIDIAEILTPGSYCEGT